MSKNTKPSYKEVFAWRDYVKGKPNLDGQEKGLLHWVENVLPNIIKDKTERVVVKKVSDETKVKRLERELSRKEHNIKENWFNGFKMGVRLVAPNFSLDYMHWLENLYEKDLINQHDVMNGRIEVQWTTGGMSGGNCWGDDANYPIEGDPEPELEKFDSIIEHLFGGGINLSNYKKLCRSLIKTETGSYNEYYGNYTNWSKKYVNLEELYKATSK